MRRKEHALHLVITAANQRGYQLLDESVGLAQIGIKKNGGRFSFVHTFDFHYADQEQHRREGKVVQEGKHWLAVEFDLVTSPNPPPQNNERKVIPFRRAP